MTEPSLWSFIINAGFVVKLVMLILLLASMTSWAIIIQRSQLLKRTKRDIKAFEKLFWSGDDLNHLYNTLKEKSRKSNMETIFNAGFNEFLRLRAKPGATPEAIMEGTERAMRIAIARTCDQLEQHLSFLATVGSTSPYIGLFGTVWGIMTSFRALGGAQQATIAMVAPGISEALIATAIGLLAAIPAVIAYNRFSNELQRLTQNYDTFQEELTTILHREAYE